MRKILVAVFMVLSFAGLGAAQVPTSGNIFVGYSYYNSKLEVDRASLNGWEGSLEGKVLPHVGIVADVSGHYGSQNFPICPVGPVGIGGGGCAAISASTHDLNVMFGPRIPSRPEDGGLLVRDCSVLGTSAQTVLYLIIRSPWHWAADSITAL